MFSGSSAAVPVAASGRPTSVLEITSWAIAPMPWPTWAPNIIPPNWFITALSGPSCERISSGSMVPIASTTRAATGSHSVAQTGKVRSIHSTRLQVSTVTTPEGRSVTSSSHRSASRTASVIWSRSAAVGSRCSSATVEIAIWRARSQFTGPPVHDISFWSSANSGILLDRSSDPGCAGSRSRIRRRIRTAGCYSSFLLSDTDHSTLVRRTTAPRGARAAGDRVG